MILIVGVIMYKSISKEIFHVHTYRCGHAENISDEMLDKAQIILNTMKISLQDLLFDYGDYIKLEEIR